MVSAIGHPAVARAILEIGGPEILSWQRVADIYSQALGRKVRLWEAEPVTGQIEWRGKLQALPDGEACYFRGWAGLIEQLEALLVAGDAEITNSSHSEGGEV